MNREIDRSIQVGHATLEYFEHADNFNRWMFETIAPCCKGNIIEIGSGIGNLSKFFLRNHFNLTATDLDPEYCSLLKERLQEFPSLKDVRHINISDTDPETHYGDLLGKFECVVAINVIEHVEDDTLAIRNCHKLLSPGGRLVILVPAYPSLYNRLDKELGHCRRYTSASLLQLLNASGFTITTKKFFNAAAIAGWLMAGLSGRTIIPKNQLYWYNKLVPLWKLTDRLLFHSAGLSLVCCAASKRVE